jgi:tRNA threonylcarbamoyladenosine biosynthesis protein TsaE
MQVHYLSNGLDQSADFRQNNTMATRTMISSDLAATEKLAASIAPRALAGDVLLLSGPLGAGKSAFARAFIRTLAGDPALDVPSPSFTLVQSYDFPVPVAHFDLWRLDSPADVAELGFDAASEGIVLIEWPDRLGGLIPADCLNIGIEWAEAETRHITLAGPARLIPDTP